jgi:prepilin-type N-terminal cleavage/methylation domain-containing protein
MNKNKKRASKGFTLLEILLVIAAIGILAAIVLVAINPTRQLNQARQAAVNSDKNTIEKALQQRLIDTGNYPAELDGVQRKICSSTVTTDCINLSSLIPDYIAAIPSSTTYTVARGNDGRVYVNTTETQGNLSCPTGYIPVPGNSMYGTSDFCVMKYEAKTGSATVAATTQATGNPQVSITQTNAITACSLNGAGYGLINNNEWMTIARNIEGQGANWTGGTVGSGGLWRGHTDNNPGNALAASTDNDPYFGTGNVSPSIERRTHTLSNGETIWDISGNVWEWTSDTIQGKDQPTGTTPGFTWRQFTALTSYGTLSYDLTRPSNTSWNSSQNMGQIFSDGTSTNTTTFAFLRGGRWNSSANAGVFALYLSVPPSNTSPRIGLRCVLR